MRYRARTFHTNEKGSEMWDRRQRGETLSSIGRRFDRASSSIFRHLAMTVSIRPPHRTRSERILSLAEREGISRGCCQTSSNQSQFDAEGVNLCGTKLSPLGKCGIAVQLETCENRDGIIDQSDYGGMRGRR